MWYHVQSIYNYLLLLFKCSVKVVYQYSLMCHVVWYLHTPGRGIKGKKIVSNKSFRKFQQTCHPFTCFLHYCNINQEFSGLDQVGYTLTQTTLNLGRTMESRMIWVCTQPMQAGLLNFILIILISAFVLSYHYYYYYHNNFYCISAHCLMKINWVLKIIYFEP